MKKLLLSFGLTLLSAGWSYAQQTCAGAQVITAGQLPIPTINGTELPPVSCTTGGTGGTAANWYKYTPTQDWSVTVTTDFALNGNVDNRVHIFSGTCGALTCVAGDDDGGTNALCVATFIASANTDYYIVFDNIWSSSGFVFALIEDSIAAPDPTAVTFTPVNNNPGGGGTATAVVDMNGDMLDDIVVVSSTNIQVTQQNTNGTFTSASYTTTPADNTPSWSLAAGDLNEDGYNDLLYGGGNGVTFMISNGAGTGYNEVSGTEYVFSQRSNFIDMNNDGHLDAFVCHDVAPNVYYINDGTGGLTFNQGGVGDHPNGGNYGSIWVDYNNDQLPDLFIAKCRGGNTTAKINELHRNNGNGTFTNVSTQANMADPVQTWSSAWNDYDNDGWMDAVVGASSNADGMHKFMHNNGDGTFSDITAGSGLDTYPGLSIEYVSYDFNNDGFTDVLTNNNILYNNGNNTFTVHPVSIIVGAVGDLNHDGFLDVQNGSTTYMNDGNSNNWIGVTLEGTTSNKNGIGARVEIYGAWGKQIRDVRSGVGFRYMGTLNTHFGIGQAPDIDSLIVRWPSGNVDVICAPVKNAYLHVIENSAPAPTASFTSSTNSIAESDSVEFTDASLPCPTSWNWSVSPATGWTFSNSTNSNSQNPSITFDVAGTYVVSLVTGNGNGLSTNVSSDTIEVISTSGLSSLTNGEGLFVYPNPAENALFIGKDQVKIMSVSVVSILGAEVQVPFDRNQQSLDVSQMESGTYFLRVTTEGGLMINTRFIKK
jgi:PKD repeat protein